MGRVMPLEDFLHPFLGRYLEAPDWLKVSAGRAYAWLPEWIRLGKTYYAFRDELSVPHDRTAIRRRASARLLTTLRWAIETVPVYQRYRSLLSHCEEPEQLLARLPVIDKVDIKRSPDLYVSGAIGPSRHLKTFTGGSTRNPMQFYLQKYVTRPKEYAFVEHFRARVGARPNQLTLALRGRTVPAAVGSDDRLWMFEPIKRQLILSSDHLEERYMPRYAEALARYRPAYIEAFPSALYPLARWLAANPLPEFTTAVKGVMLYSENVFGYQMRTFREVFPCPVLKHYGHSERVLMAASMPDDDRYFFWPQYGWFELLDFNDRPITQPGVLGHIVGTGFDNRVMPFVRYRTGDLGVLSEREHPRLPGYTACERIEGRLQEFVVCRDHRLISVTTLGTAHFPWLADMEVIQYEQEHPGRLTLKFVADKAPSPALQDRIAAAVSEKTQGGCEVTLAQVGHITRTSRGKRHMLIQKLDINRYLGASAFG